LISIITGYMSVESNYNVWIKGLSRIVHGIPGLGTAGKIQLREAEAGGDYQIGEYPYKKATDRVQLASSV